MKSKFFRVCICIALCLCLFTGVFAVMGWGSLLRQVGSTVMYPFSWLAGKTADAAAGFAGYFRDIRDLQAENDALLKEMAKAVIQMVTESVDAYVKCDIMLAKKVIAADDVVDEQFARVKQSLIGKIAADPADGEYALDLLMIAKYYERIGDHATNIAEWVIYSVTGTHKDEITLT